MKKIINLNNHIVDDMLSGYVKDHSDRVQLEQTNKRIIIRNTKKDKSKIPLLIGNGSGHEPIAVGWVGEGLLDANVVGDIFASPSGDQIFEGIKLFQSHPGIILLISNHSGDVMNGEMAIELADDEIALCADTTVALGRRILGKPSDRKEANRFLSLLSGRRHKVITCVSVKKQNQLKVKDVISVVKMKVLSFQEIEAYLDSGDWKGKAGGYGIQGPAASFIPWISGSYTGIVGLPLTETMNLLGSLKYPIFGSKDG